MCNGLFTFAGLRINLQTGANLLEGGQDRMERQIAWIWTAAQALHLATWSPYGVTSASAGNGDLAEPRASMWAKPRTPAAYSEIAFE